MDFDGILAHLPSTDFSFAYGSGVFEQKGYENAKEAPMIDMVLATSNATQWHEVNLQRNRAHYSILGALGPAALTGIQEDFGAGLYYNTLVSSACPRLMSSARAERPPLHNPVLPRQSNPDPAPAGSNS